MSNNRFITDDVAYVGASDNRLRLFENLFPLPHGVSYNSYVILDNECALIDTVDESVSEEFFNNLNRALGGRSLDYVIVNHMEPDHSATLMKTLSLYPEATL
ncbi:MAG: FprA family A-type flavoprotein, partial [Clostridia bacterium]